jgi:ABC-type nitrate/sulfonate/bicarbonate transport system ATPase subunit
VDISAEETIYNFLEKLKEKRDLTILLVTHDLSVVYKFSTNVKGGPASGSRAFSIDDSLKKGVAHGKDV